MSKVLRVEDLEFKYNDIQVLKDINFNLELGDFVGILGPNGSGKTTLLNNINRWLSPNKGSIYINDINTTKMIPKKLAKLIGTVPQNAFLDVGFTVRQVVLMGRNPHIKSFEQEKPEDLEIVKETMAVMDVLHLQNKTLSQLSGGEKQRVMIARALAQQPDLLLLDEPTAHLDINYQWELLDLLKKLCDSKKITVLTVLHDINLATMFCNKIILLNQHKIFAMGSVVDVINKRNLKKVFNMDVEVSLQKGSNRPFVLLLDKKQQPNKQRPFDKIHLICGGGEGETLLNYLGNRGYQVSVGVLNKGDTDLNTAKMLGFSIIEERPFSTISNQKIMENIKYMQDADAIIIANIPFGNGNIKNLNCLENVSNDKMIIILEEKPIETRDYTNGIASKIYKKIKSKSKVYCSLDELKTFI
ncbi:MAG TPA: ABC transporter ATP-binding protein [Thermoanaerobacterales bacterium]|nr:ABC transporter ATP-binding protein [Thermoanaerobacterales bacterium]